MKTILTLFITLLFAFSSIAQNGINYKAVIKDSNDNIMVNQNIDVQFNILEGAITVYSETHQPTTDENGFIILNIGEGASTDDFDAIDWASDDHFLNVQVNTGSGLIGLGTTQFMAVPYALNANNVTGLEAINEGAGVSWRLVGRNPDNYGNIGGGAIDLSSSTDNAQDYGATGTGAFATGFRTIASGGHSTAMGNNTIASGIRSTTMGLSSNASGGNSTAMGENTTASGLVSTAMGNNTTASGENSTALGRSTDAIGENSVAMGGFTEALGDFSFAFGNGSEAQGNYSIALGDDAFATNQYAVAMGRDALASGLSSFATGYNTVASGDYSTAMGSSTEASGTYATATGSGTEASGRLSIAMGLSTIASAYISTAFGRNNISGGSPTLWIGTDPLFEIGNGTSVASRSNAMTVLKNGNTGIGTSAPQERLHIANGRLRIGTETIEDSGSNQLSFGASLIPDANNAYRLGNSSSRWIGVWAVDGTINTSDRRDKENITDINYGLKEIQKLKPVSYNWKKRPEAGVKLGLIAQDLQTIIPEVVMSEDIIYSDDDSTSFEKKPLDRLGVYYSDLIPVLIKAIQEQQDIINLQKAELASQEAELASQGSEIEFLSEEVSQIQQLTLHMNQLVENYKNFQK